ncbi:MAG TPA: thermonuclease family protein [Chloroflexota bacterium]|nr:thermonuclease family protein [Chloroflexota bacterium]
MSLQRWIAGAIGLCLLLQPPLAAAQQVDDTPTPEAQVNRVIDGSTLDAQINGIRVPVGYLGIETMEANQPCGQAALERNRELAGDRVLLMSDPLYEFDPLGRRLYYAFTVDGVSIDEVLVREGLAHAVRTDAVEGNTLAAAEAEAAAAGRGCLWGNEQLAISN